MKTLSSALFLVLLAASIVRCKKSGENDRPLRIHTFAVESIVGPFDEQSTVNKCYINLFEGVAYTKAEAEAQSSKVDFAYNYHGGGCETCRWFENVSQLYGRTRYVDDFSTITNSTIATAEQDGLLTTADFDAIRTSGDIDQLLTNYIPRNSSADITNRTSDQAVNRIFAFIDKDGRKGLFKVGDYAANVPNGDKATLTLTVKIVE